MCPFTWVSVYPFHRLRWILKYKYMLISTPVCSIASDNWSAGSVLIVTMGGDTECWGWSWWLPAAARMMVGCLVTVTVLVVMVVTVVSMGSMASISGSISVLTTCSCPGFRVVLFVRSRAWLLPKNSLSKSKSNHS